MSPIRVLLTVPHLTSTASPYRQMMAVAKFLPRDEFDLTICALRGNGSEETLPQLEAMNVSCFIARFRPRGHSPKKFWEAFRDQALIRQKGFFDIQHSWDFSSLPFEGLLAKFHARHFIFVQRNMNQNGYKAFVRLKAVLASKVQTNSDATTRLLLSYGVPSVKLRKIYNGFDLSELLSLSYEHHSDEEPYVLFVGHLQQNKRQEDAIKALARLKDTFPHLRLKLAGNTYDIEYYHHLQRLTADLGLTDRVDFLGVRTDVLELMRSAKALILCSEQEAFGWAILEAMTVGLPVVASAVDGPSEVINHEKTGLLVPVGDIESYAAALQRILSSPQLAKELAANARRQVEKNYSAERMVSEIADLYREVVTQPVPVMASR